MNVKRAPNRLYVRNLGDQRPDYWRQFPGRTKWVKRSGTVTPRIEKHFLDLQKTVELMGVAVVIDLKSYF